MIGNEQESPLVGLVDEFPLLQRVLERVLRRECQRHCPVVTLTIYSRSETLEALHHDHLEAILRVQRHVGEKELSII